VSDVLGWTRRTAVASLVTVAVLGAATPATADPAGPTNYDSRLTGLEAEDGTPSGEVPVRFEILGGDAFLAVSAAPGTEVEVPGYDGEPYVRIAADGTVEVNQRSPSRWLNDARYGAEDVEVPPEADAAAPPRWEVVATDGEYAWHDHRIHWMSPSLPRQVDPAAGTAQPVTAWTVPLRVDGQPLTLTGELRWLPGPSPAVPGSVALLAVAGAAALARLRPGWAPAAVAAGGLLALGTGLAGTTGLPAGADADPFLVVLPALALAVVGVGALLGRGGPARGTGPAGRARLVAAAGGLPLLVWVVLQAAALTRPIVPGALPAGLVRTAVAVAAVTGLAGLLVAGRTALAATSLDRAEAAPDAG
jgi:hypothetical protein